MQVALRRSGRILVPATLILLFVVACSHERKVDVAKTLDPTNMPTMKTVNVSTLISDSGITQYKIVSPVWYVYDNVDNPYWNFPKGLYLRKYDRKFRVIATVAADSARYFKDQRLWRLDGNVEMTKDPSDVFLSQQLFWDESRHIIYTDSFMHVENSTHVLEGYGFRSDDRLITYSIVKPSGIFPVDRSTARPDSLESRTPRRMSAPFLPAPSDPVAAPVSAPVGTPD